MPGGITQRHITAFAQAIMPTSAQPRIGASSHGPGCVLRGTSPHTHKPTCTHQHRRAPAHSHRAYRGGAQRRITTFALPNMLTSAQLRIGTSSHGLGVCTDAHHHDLANQHAHTDTATHRHILTWPGGVHSCTSPRQHKPTCPQPHSRASAHPHMAWRVCTVAYHHDSTNQHALNRTAAHRHILTWPGECAQSHITTTAQTNMPSTAPPRIGTASHGLRGVHRGTSPRSHKPASPHQHSHASAHPHMAPGRVHSCTSPRPHKPTCSHQHGHASAHPHRASGGCTAAHHHVRTGQHAHINTTTHRRNSTVGVAHRGTSPRTHLST